DMGPGREYCATAADGEPEDLRVQQRRKQPTKAGQCGQSALKPALFLRGHFRGHLRLDGRSHETTECKEWRREHENVSDRCARVDEKSDCVTHEATDHRRTLAEAGDERLEYKGLLLDVGDTH